MNIPKRRDLTHQIIKINKNHEFEVEDLIFKAMPK